MIGGFRLRTIGITMMIVSFSAGIGSATLWFSSSQAWDRHLTRAYLAGIASHAALVNGTTFPEGVIASRLPDDQATIAAAGGFARLPDLPRPTFITNVSLLTPGAIPTDPAPIKIAIVSDSLSYAVSEIVSEPAQSNAQKFGNVTRLLATYCSEPVVFVTRDSAAWWRLDGRAIWGCGAAPSDLRLWAILLAALGLAALGTAIIEGTSHFDRFAAALRNRRRLGGPESYSASGPAELREIVGAVNSYLEAERVQLAKRAFVLSGVSHDLGTPATRLRLRTALIPDADLRKKLEADIDSMTGMIESVLTYTRAELSAEEPRQISLSSLLQSIVDDYADTGKPVVFEPPEQLSVSAGKSVFTSKGGQGILASTQPILVVARPVSLKRAVANLIDNALKYGRRASVSLKTDATRAVIMVEDAGSGISPEDVEAAIAPFTRGANVGTVSGFGLGLTIVATVAEQHGGDLRFEMGRKGLRACLQISRLH